jgi:hypothetical protein
MKNPLNYQRVAKFVSGERGKFEVDAIDYV